MPITPLTPPDADTLTALQAQMQALMEQLTRVSVGRDALQAERDLLRERVAAFERKFFAASSEARSTHQRDLFFNEAEMLDAGPPPKRRMRIGTPPRSPHTSVASAAASR